MSRLPNQPGELINRGKVIRFTFDGKAVEAYEGDTVGSALFADGRRTFSRSFKYHRRRGLLCCAGQCPNCIVAVDGAPGVRACTEPVREGMRVEHLNAQPGLDFDVMRTTDLVGTRFTPPGFYYKTFIRPRKLWPVYEKVLRHAAGLGVLRKQQPEREWRTEYRRRHADVLVIGGGIAGVSAAKAAAAQGADVVLVDEGPAPIEPVSGVEILGAGERARLLRRDRPGVAGRHAPPDPRPQPRIRHRHDRAAAGVRRQRPPRGNAVRRRAPPDPAVRGQPRDPRGARDDLGPRTGGRGQAGRRRRPDRRGRGSAREPDRGRAAARRARDRGADRPPDPRGEGSHRRASRRSRADRRRGRLGREDVRMRPRRRLGRVRAGNVAPLAGRRTCGL